MNVTVSCMNVEEQRTQQITDIMGNEIDQCTFDEYMLFILPFHAVKDMVKDMENRKHNALEFRLSYKWIGSAEEKDDESDENFVDDDHIFIGKTSPNLTNYETIWRK